MVCLWALLPNLNKCMYARVLQLKVLNIPLVKRDKSIFLYLEIWLVNMFVSCPDGAGSEGLVTSIGRRAVWESEWRELNGRALCRSVASQLMSYGFSFVSVEAEANSLSIIRSVIHWDHCVKRIRHPHAPTTHTRTHA